RLCLSRLAAGGDMTAPEGTTATPLTMVCSASTCQRPASSRQQAKADKAYPLGADTGCGYTPRSTSIRQDGGPFDGVRARVVEARAREVVRACALLAGRTPPMARSAIGSVRSDLNA